MVHTGIFLAGHRVTGRRRYSLVLLVLTMVLAAGCSDDTAPPEDDGHPPPFSWSHGLALDADPGLAGEVNRIGASMVPNYDGGGWVALRGTSGGRVVGEFTDGSGEFTEVRHHTEFTAGEVVSVEAVVELYDHIDIVSLHAEAWYDSLYVAELDEYIPTEEIGALFGYQYGPMITASGYIPE